MIVSSRTAGNWGSLKTILNYLETEAIAAAICATDAFDLSVLENLWKPRPSEMQHLECLLFLHVDNQALRLAQACREFNPAIRMLFFLSPEAPALCPSFFAGERPFPASSQDCFVVLCQSDAKLVRQIFPAATVRIVQELDPRPILPVSTDRVTKFVYAGRISFNKNLHNLVLAYAKARAQKGDLAPLHLFGFQDSSVQQFKEVSVEHYQQKLETVIADLGLEASVHLHPHTSGEEWSEILREEGLVYVSASLNADENYGLAPREFIAQGHRAILTQWGGFQDILAKYPERTRAVPLLRSSATSIQLSIQGFTAALLEPWKVGETQATDPRAPSTGLFHFEDLSGPATSLAVAPAILSLQAELKKIKEAHWHEAGPYRFLHQSSELLARQIDGYSAATVTAAPEKGELVPWVTEREGQWHSLFEEAAAVAREDQAGLWQRGWLY